MTTTPFTPPSNTILPPKVQRAMTAADAIDPQSDNLPLGIKLTGGTKLRADGLTGKGVKVAVIDSD